MAENNNARTRLLILIDILRLHSNEGNVLSIEEICSYLEEYGYHATKRNILADIKLINTTPHEIIYVTKPKKGYYIAKAFSQEAISLILESVFSSELLTDNDVEYIKKIKGYKVLVMGNHDYKAFACDFTNQLHIFIMMS